MTFTWPILLILLLLLPVFVLLYFRLLWRRQQVIKKFGAIGQVQGASTLRDPRRHIPALMFLIGLAILIVALARPATQVTLPHVEGTVLLAFDISGSMAADDFKPNRMEAAKVAAKGFVEKQPSNVLIGVVAFSESGIQIQVPTKERDAVLAAINRLSPQRGTSLASGMFAALDAIFPKANEGPLYSNLTATPMLTPTPVPQGVYNSAVMVLLTDGENNVDPDPLEAAQAAKDRGVRIYTVGVGSAAGANLKVEGFTVHTQLDEKTLQQIAQLTDAAYYNASDEDDLKAIYENLKPQLVFRSERTEVTSLFTMASLAVILIGAVFSLIWFGKAP